MIIVLTPTDAPRLTDLDRFDRLHAELHGAADDAVFDELCRPGPDGHVWCHIATARARGASTAGDPAYVDKFDAMIEFAGGHGWLDDDSTHVRAHIQPAD